MSGGSTEFILSKVEVLKMSECKVNAKKKKDKVPLMLSLSKYARGYWKRKKNMKQTRSYFIPALVAVIVVGGALAFTIYQYYRQSRRATDRIIAEQLEQLVAVFTKIEEDCEILDILHDRSYIDFLNVRSFSGSEVGSLNLVHPEKWQGPYMIENPTMQGKLYEIIHTKSGYYIVPGQGVKLTNGKIIGKDIILSQQTDIAQVSNKKVGLVYQDKSLIARLPMKDRTVAPDLLLDSERYNDEV